MRPADDYAKARPPILYPRDGQTEGGKWVSHSFNGHLVASVRHREFDRAPPNMRHATAYRRIDEGF